MASNPCRFYRQQSEAEREPITLPRERVEQIAAALDELIADVEKAVWRSRELPDPAHLEQAAVLRDELLELLAPSPYEGKDV